MGETPPRRHRSLSKDDEDEDFYEEKRDELLAKDIRILNRRVPAAAEWVDCSSFKGYISFLPYLMM